MPDCRIWCVRFSSLRCRRPVLRKYMSDDARAHDSLAHGPVLRASEFRTDKLFKLSRTQDQGLKSTSSTRELFNYKQFAVRVVILIKFTFMRNNIFFLYMLRKRLANGSWSVKYTRKCFSNMLMKNALF